MNRGRPRKPDHIKKAQGTLRNRPSKSILLPVQVDKVENTMPMQLSDRQKDLFEIICQSCSDAGILMERFIPSLIGGAIIWDKWIDAVNGLNEEGLIQEAQSGWQQKSAYLSAFCELSKLKADFENSWGITLTGYEKLGLKKLRPFNPDFDRILNG